MSQTRKYNRNWSTRRSTDILFNPQTKAVWFSIDMGWAGQVSFNLTKNDKDTYDVFKTYFQNREAKMVKVGSTRPAKNKQDDDVVGITTIDIPLRKSWSKELNKNINTYEDIIRITTHKLKEPVVISDKLVKVGYIQYQFAFEIDAPQEETAQTEQTQEEIPEVDEENEEEIPF